MKSLSKKIVIEKNSSVDPLAKSSPVVSEDMAAFESKEGNNKSSDVLRIIDSFAKEGIKPYKREMTVQEYKDVMRAAVRECYKKKILNGIEIKDKVKKYVETLRRGEPLSLGHCPSKRPIEPNHSELPLPTKHSKTDL
ncbi:hypothetical protein KIN20_022190 [Parelaphostrongylus tenuis]|uniref:Uncharacterized protein n=1 Tax=Parelaphostrongylus tenuis TaxID=148309 RepID=A0AAD5N5D7_PARTN|nr:hypothetical protein KIN20_022190 [Parelaphostrongylus tenuis]